jgi:hypothetical protein
MTEEKAWYDNNGFNSLMIFIFITIMIFCIIFLMNECAVLQHQLTNMTNIAYDFCRSADSCSELANICLDKVDDGSLGGKRISHFDCSHMFEDMLGVEGVVN